jgi:osmotically-inducible protein OsmY
MALLRKAPAVIAALAALPLTLSGCVGVAVVGGLAAAGGAGYVAGQERGVNGLASDLAIRSTIQSNLMSADPRFQQGVVTTVYEGRVLLAGRVPTWQMKTVADGIARRVRGVRAVYDQLVVAGPETAWDDTKDAWITAQIRSKLMFDPGIRSNNYLIDTENGSVYLLGSARDQDELNRVTQIARYVAGVRRVVSFIQLRPGAPPAIAAVPARPAGAASAPPPVAGAAPIYERKL